MEIQTGLFGTLNDGREVSYCKIINSRGEYLKVLDLGGIVNELCIRDREGNISDIVCGYDTPQKYYDTPGYQGAIIGRYANRIGNSSFTLDGTTYKLFTNSGKKSSLHGGRIGFDKKIWEIYPFNGESECMLVLHTVSQDGEEGYPGTLDVTVTYTFDEDGKFTINYRATTDKPTVVNLTNHSYFNLNGYDGGSVMDNILWIDADSYLEVDEEQIPYGPVSSVKGNEFDFTIPKKIGVGFDHNFIFNAYNGMIKRRAQLYCEKSGRRMTVYTNSPAIQLYTGCVMDSPENFKGGVPQVPLCAVCLETQFFPDTPNKPDYPSCILRPGEIFDFTTVFEFKNV